jgi:hypothetical protein
VVLECSGPVESDCYMRVVGGGLEAVEERGHAGICVFSMTEMQTLGI